MCRIGFVSDEKKYAAEKQISTAEEELHFSLQDFSVEYIADKFQKNELYVSDEYERHHIWNKDEKNRFIESILIGLPVANMYFSETDDGRHEILDGCQRVHALEEFRSGDLILEDLKKLTALNGFAYDDIPIYFRMKFDNTFLRTVVLYGETSPEMRQDIFSRLNVTDRSAKTGAPHQGNCTGSFFDFFRECTENDLFEVVCPLSKTMYERHEHIRLAAGFFAFLEQHQDFSHGGDAFPDRYIEEKNSCFDRKAMKAEFDRMLKFVGRYFPYGFAQNERAKSVSRVRFEAISAGVALALRAQPDLVPDSMVWLESEEFRRHTLTHARDPQSRVSGRILYVRQNLLTGQA